MQNLNQTHSAGRAGQPARWSRRLTAGAIAVLLGASGLGFAGTANAAPAADAGKRDAQSPTYVPGASVQPTTAESESERYNTWHFGPGDGYAQRVEQQRNGVLLEAGAPTQVIRGNGNDVKQTTDSTPLGDVLDGLELVASDKEDLSYQVGVRVDVNASGTWDDGDLWTTLRAPVGDPSVWTTSQAVGGLGAGAAAPADEMLAALGDRAYAISTGFLAWKPAEPVLVSSFTDTSGVTKFRPAPEATPAGEEKRESAPEIRPNGDTFPGWHDAADAGGRLSYESTIGQWVPGGLNMYGKVQLIKGLEESAYLTNGIDRAQSMRVAATPKSPWDHSEDEDPAAPLWAQVLVRAYPDGVRDVPVDVIVRAAVPKNGDLSQASEWMLSAPVGGVPADTPVSFDEIRAALGEHDVTGYGVFLDTGDYAYLGQIVFNGTTTGFVQSSMPWIVNWSVKLSATTVKPGETITITGTGFDNGGEVLIAGLCRETVPVEATTSFTVTCTVPDDQEPGEVDLAVGYGSVKSRYFITIEAADKPVDPPVEPAAVWSRLGGADRFETAVTVSREHFPNGAKAVVLSRYDVPADALTAAPFAVKQDAPLLLTQTGTLTAATKTELQRLKPDTVYIAGGTGAVSAGVEQQVGALGAKTVRMGGKDRYATANQIAKTGWGKTGASAVFIATGRDFPDALSAGAAAGGVDAPVLLVDGKAGSVRADVQAQITALKPAAVHIAGGTGVVSKGIESGLGRSAKVARHSGADRYATSAAIAKAWHAKSGTVYLATGAGFADALTGAAVAGGKPGPVLLVRSGCVPASVAGVLGEIAPQAGYVLGGSGVVSERVLTNRNTCA
ncbi:MULTISPECIES: cell wall-binding repeat-containing protein [unclassified Leucobacter]|nr:MULTISPECIES: cell wall-binding repeat-containing protein [unclassified Leucobacter]